MSRTLGILEKTLDSYTHYCNAVYRCAGVKLEPGKFNELESAVVDSCLGRRTRRKIFLTLVSIGKESGYEEMVAQSIKRICDRLGYVAGEEHPWQIQMTRNRYIKTPRRVIRRKAEYRTARTTALNERR